MFLAGGWRSGVLRAIFSKPDAIALSNDTSCGVGFAPLTPVERVVLAVEKQLNSGEIKLRHPAPGQDVKVMGVRHGPRVRLTIGCAMIGRFLADAAVNAADDPDRGEMFLTVTGTSAESGDDGEVGRGNRACGLITPYRPMSIEAVSGKNPVNHVGKLYNLAAARIAERLERRQRSGLFARKPDRPPDRRPSTCRSAVEA